MPQSLTHTHTPMACLMMVHNTHLDAEPSVHSYQPTATRHEKPHSESPRSQTTAPRARVVSLQCQRSSSQRWGAGLALLLEGVFGALGGAAAPRGFREVLRGDIGSSAALPGFPLSGALFEPIDGLLAPPPSASGCSGACGGSPRASGITADGAAAAPPLLPRGEAQPRAGFPSAAAPLGATPLGDGGRLGFAASPVARPCGLLTASAPASSGTALACDGGGKTAGATGGGCGAAPVGCGGALRGLARGLLVREVLSTSCSSMRLARLA
mmetsp:Transcript_24933/g.50085  ORF Transcript_24933/g.50085 Transcript_24933/m.50085 type:complete len:269 (+) Transcript_24933:128-934(+)